MTQWIAGNGIRNTATFGGAGIDFRLQQLQVADSGGWVYQQLDYAGSGGAGYDPVGNLLGLADNSSYGASLKNSWMYRYEDGLGRLTSAALNGAAPTGFGYDGLGNMTTYGGLAFTPSNTQPHHILHSTPGGIQTYQYDDNGGLMSRPDTDGTGSDTARTVTYDLDGRVRTVTTADGHTVRSVYNYRGERVARIVDESTTPTITFYYGRWFDVTGSALVRHIYLGDRLIADSPVTAPSGLAALPESERTILLARAIGEAVATRPGLYPVVALSGMAAVAVGSGVLVLCVGLGFAPGRVRLAYLGKVRRGRVAVVIVLFAVALSPLPLVRPAWAGGGGGGGGGGSPPPISPVYFIHTDHLGSTLMLTCYKQSSCGDGAVARYYRYDAYGQPTAYNPSSGTVIPISTALINGYVPERLYTGQRWDWQAQVYYYGARFYDPKIANFLTEDPVRQGPNPYAYAGWNPVRFTDPTGMISIGGAWGTGAGFTSLGYTGWDTGRFSGYAGAPGSFNFGGGGSSGAGGGGGGVGGGAAGISSGQALARALFEGIANGQRFTYGGVDIGLNTALPASLFGISSGPSSLSALVPGSLGELISFPLTLVASLLFSAISRFESPQTVTIGDVTGLVFGGNPSGGYLTLGHSILGAESTYENLSTGKATVSDALYLSHEFGHIGQADVLGPAFLAAYLVQVPAALPVAAATHNPFQMVQFNIFENFFLGGGLGSYQLQRLSLP